MCTPWKKLKKDEKEAYAKHKIMKGVGIFLFGAIWMYFTSVFFDVWSALPPTIAVVGILYFLLGMFKRSSI